MLRTQTRLALVLALACLAFLRPALAAASPDPGPVSGTLGGCAVRPAEARSPSAHLRGIPEAPVVEVAPSSDLTYLRWLDLMANPVTEEIDIQIVDGTVGLLLRADTANDAYTLFVELLDSKGELLACADCVNTPVVGESSLGRGMTQMPSTDRPGWELEPGTYSFRVRAKVAPGSAPVPGGVRVNVVMTTRTETAVELDRYIDLNFVYLPGSTLSEEIATNSPLFAELLVKVDEWLGPMGMKLGRVTHRDLDEPEFTNIGTWEEAGRMFLTSTRVGRPRALNVYCIHDFVGALHVAAGLSGGIPGPTHNGTRDSGIALRMWPFFTCNDGQGCNDIYAAFFAHEIGHYLGLYHTSEFVSRDIWDPIGDTPECPPTEGIRSCPDWAYTMFPVIGEDHDLWSPAQLRIIQAHPLIRTVPVLAAGPRSVRPQSALRAYPNPFRESVRFEWASTTGKQAVSAASVYDLAGRRVRSLEGRFAWDGRDSRGRDVPAGVYFVRFETPDGARNLRVVKQR